MVGVMRRMSLKIGRQRYERHVTLHTKVHVRIRIFGIVIGRRSGVSDDSGLCAAQPRGSGQRDTFFSIINGV